MDAILKKSTIREAIRAGEFGGWDDVRLGTLRAMRARGIQPQAIREVWREIGTNPVDIVFSWENLLAFNKQAVNDSADRFFFCADPLRMDIRTEVPLRLRAPVHPDHPERGFREYGMEPAGGTVAVFVPSAELPPSGPLRLKDLCNVELDGPGGSPERAGGPEAVEQGSTADAPRAPRTASYAGNDLSVLKRGVGILQAVPAAHAVLCSVMMPDGASVEGVAEDLVRRLAPPAVVQFERFGFVNVVRTAGRVVANFAHK